jgi:hypothetical protein
MPIPLNLFAVVLRDVVLLAMKMRIKPPDGASVAIAWHGDGWIRTITMTLDIVGLQVNHDAD